MRKILYTAKLIWICRNDSIRQLWITLKLWIEFGFASESPSCGPATGRCAGRIPGS